MVHSVKPYLRLGILIKYKTRNYYVQEKGNLTRDCVLPTEYG